MLEIMELSHGLDGRNCRTFALLTRYTIFTHNTTATDIFLSTFNITHLPANAIFFLNNLNL